MRTPAWLLAGLLMLGWSASVALADLRPRPPVPPIPPKPSTVPFVIQVDDKATPPHLEIPRKMVVAMSRASLDEDEPDTRRAEATPRVHTILAGSTLALALATGGFWLVRSGNRFTRRGTVLFLATAALLTVGAVSLWADIARPGTRPPLPPGLPPGPVIPPGVQLGDGVVIDIVPRGDAIRLIISGKDLQDILDASKKKPAAPPAGNPPPKPPKK